MKRDQYYSCPHCRVYLFYLDELQDDLDWNYLWYCKKCKRFWDITNTIENPLGEE
jgi:uncharacterized protein YbaR (Trm112 family)